MVACGWLPLLTRVRIKGFTLSMWAVSLTAKKVHVKGYPATLGVIKLDGLFGWARDAASEPTSLPSANSFEL